MDSMNGLPWQRGRKAEAQGVDWWVEAERASGSVRVGVLVRNFRCKAGELDWIAEVEDERGQIELVFGEVRSRSVGSWVSGEDSVGPFKRRSLERAARWYLTVRYRGRAETTRFDLIVWDGRRWILWRHAWESR